ncbi:MAG: HAD-IC family P-type ATPase [Clostridiales bacterium]|nr:HAD-IC family P-type ATPase [Clostridiales bacterium]
MDGLSSVEVKKRIDEGQVNRDKSNKTKSVGRIIADNFFTYFNILNLVLGIGVIVAGIVAGDILKGLKNCTFVLIAIGNTIISIAEELASKRIIDRLSIISESKCVVVRDGEENEISAEDIVIDDIIKLTAGRQIIADAEVLEGSLEVNEALITGESDPVIKQRGDQLLSGAFVVSGSAYCRVTHVGKDNYSSKISAEAKQKKKMNFMILGSFIKILKVLTILIIPLGAISFFKEFNISGDLSESMFRTIASIIGMIPEGLILLTSSVMAVGIIKLYRVKVLVQQLYSIETLARVNTICLDKTGTLTEGRMEYVDFVTSGSCCVEDPVGLLSDFVICSDDNNATMQALKDHFVTEESNSKDTIEKMPFSSSRKYSAIKYSDYTYYFGAPDILFDDTSEAEECFKKYRVVAFARKKNGELSDISSLEKIGYVLIKDVVRKSAKSTLEFFKKNNVDVVIISGDKTETVLNTAEQLDLKDLNGIDVSNLSDEELISAISQYNVFGRVKPAQKKLIVKTLKDMGRTVAMTGDGVNDVLALKESDCAISIKSGADAARNVSQFILLEDDFNSIPNIVKEGRQIINNIERSASLLLSKTVYTLLLTLFSVVTLQKYFFIPIQTSLITFFTIGVPTFVLALEPNNELVKGKFLTRIASRSIPVSITVLMNVILATIASHIFDLDASVVSTMAVIMTAVTVFLYMIKICLPLTKIRIALLVTMIGGFFACTIFMKEFFYLSSLDWRSILILGALFLISFVVYSLVNFLVTFLFHKKDDSILVEKTMFSRLKNR